MQKPLPFPHFLVYIFKNISLPHLPIIFFHTWAFALRFFKFEKNKTFFSIIHKQNNLFFY